MEQERTVNSMIECRQISKSFPGENGSMEIVHSMNLSVGENEFVVLLGPGQCGKTTIINLIAGLETVTSGEVMVDGKKVLEPGPERGVPMADHYGQCGIRSQNGRCEQGRTPETGAVLY